MKNIFRSWIYILLMYSILILANSCKKDDDTTIQVFDIDGNRYIEVEIGTQIWLKENLRTTKYRNSDVIETTIPATLDISGYPAPTNQWAYAGDEINVDSYGRLYSWYAANDSRGVCPTGWHVPTDAEWTTLTDFLGGESVAQKALKEKGFSPQYGGLRHSFGDFLDLDLYGNTWSTTEVESSVPGAIDQVYSRVMAQGSNNVYRSYNFKKSALSIRCVKN